MLTSVKVSGDLLHVLHTTTMPGKYHSSRLAVVSMATPPILHDGAKNLSHSCHHDQHTETYTSCRLSPQDVDDHVKDVNKDVAKDVHLMS